MARYPNLLSPIKLGPLTLRHRAVVAGHSMVMGESDGSVGERLCAYVVARARGGAAFIGMESAPVHPGSVHYAQQLRLYDDAVLPGLTRTAEAVHAAGSLLSIILWHGGHNVTHYGGQPGVAPSPVPSYTIGETPKVLSVGEIQEIVAAYGSAARRCREAGLDAVEVQTALDYLLGSFLSPTLNRRTDAYGGSPENRVRIVAEILETVREATGGKLAVGIRTSTAHLIPGDPHGYGIEDSLAAMRHLVERGLVDWVSVMTGTRWSHDRGIAPMSTPRSFLAEQSAHYKSELDVPIVVAGRIRTAEEAESILAKEQADLIGMARPWIADPDWMNKVERGEEARIRPCMSCNQGCLGFARRGLPGTCVINPVAGREFEFGDLERVPKPRRVIVIGGGPAGLEAARVAALRGHRVRLYEAEDRLGGAMRLAGEAPHRAEILPAISWWQSELERLGVEVSLGERISDTDELDADDVVWAIGARPGATAVWRLRPYLVDGIPGTRDLPHGRDILAGARSVSGDVLVIDEEGGWMSISLVEGLAARPDVRSVTIVTSWRPLGGPEIVVTLEALDLLVRLEKVNVTVRLETLVNSVEGGAVTLAGGEIIGPFDGIVLSTGASAPKLPEGALAVGDCVAPRGFWGATHDAAILARSL